MGHTHLGSWGLLLDPTPWLVVLACDSGAWDPQSPAAFLALSTVTCSLDSEGTWPLASIGLVL